MEIHKKYNISLKSISSIPPPNYPVSASVQSTNSTKVFDALGFSLFFFFFFFSNNFRFTSYKYVTFGYPKVHRPTYLIVISIDDLAPNRPQIHDDVIEWKHFPRYWPFVRGIHRSPMNSTVPVKFPTQRPVTRSFGVLFDLPLNNGWVNNREAGDLRRYRAHYDAVFTITHVLSSQTGCCDWRTSNSLTKLVRSDK